VLVHLALASIIWIAGFLLFGRFIAPRWKVVGKLLVYLLVTAMLSRTVGHFALIWIIAHPVLGIAGHIWWCRKHGINWLTCEPREKYLALRPWAAADGFAREIANRPQN
jgi:uncharacterized membrane protein